ncbi:MAG TPA: condensation domain-containing protein, partial [Pyrinomonadaceae bacterium]|nr:condensation domain-containing protein [Pyrinomonadaceae bacterium]
GFRVEVGEVEAALLGHGSVRECAVAVRGEGGGARLVGYVVAEGGDGADFVELREHLRERLPAYMVPSQFVTLDALPLTPNGKLDRKALPEPGRAEAGAGEDEPPRTPTEEVLAGIWAEVLGLERIGRGEDFFELGGHSLLATQVVSRVRQAFSVELPLRQFFETPTVAGLSEAIERGMGVGVELPPISRAPRGEGLSLSYAQQRLWFIDQMQPGNSAYNIPSGVRIGGRLHVEALGRALEEVARRHETLRTSFPAEGGRPVQVISPPAPVALDTTDLSQSPAESREEEARRLAAEEAQRPFDLPRGPLWRASLVKLADDEHILLLTMHHIVSDGWSVGLLVEELAALYVAFARGEEPSLAELPVQYADFAHWQRERLAGEALGRQLAYWRDRLAGAPPVSELPIDRPRPPVRTLRGGRVDRDLPPELGGALQALGRSEGATLFMVLLAAFETLLYRHTGQADIVVGTDIAGRNRVEVERLIGFFVNNLVLRTDLSGNPTFRELLRRVRETALGAYAHQDVPFDKLVEALRPERSLSHTPLFQVLFVLQNNPRRLASFPGLSLSALPLDNETSKFDLSLFVEEAGDRHVGVWRYNADIFEAATVERLARRFEQLLRSAVENPEARLDELEMLGEAERRARDEEERRRQASRLSKFRSVKPKPVNLPSAELVKTGFLPGCEGAPLVCEPALGEVELAEWARLNAATVEASLHRHGAILFRNFKVESVADFERCAAALCRELFSDYGDLPPEGGSRRVYHSTPYPPHKPILFHNESSHMHRWPTKQFFHCVEAAREGGETPIADCRKVYRLLDPRLVERFARKGLLYLRNFTDGLDVSWRDFFKTDDRAAVEDYCRRAGIEFRWKPDGLRIRQRCPAVVRHPKTGEPAFFNQIQLHHVSCLEPEVRRSLESLFGEEDFPRNVSYGDGSPIEDSVVAEILGVYRGVAVAFPWRRGDILMLDNMLVAHARNPYAGPRKIVVAMGEMFDAAGVEG